MKTALIHNYHLYRTGSDYSFDDTAKAFRKRFDLELFTVDSANIVSMGIAEKVRTAAAVIMQVSLTSDERAFLRRAHAFNAVILYNTVPLISPLFIKELKMSGTKVIYRAVDYKPWCPEGKAFLNGKECRRCMRSGIGCAVNRCYGTFTVSSLYALRFHLLRKVIEKNVDLIIASSRLLAGFMKMQFPGVDVVSAWDNVYIPEEMDSDDSVKGTDAVYIGMIEESRGIDNILRAAQRLPHRRFGIYGGGKYADAVQEKVLSRGLKNVVFSPFKTHIQALRIIRDAYVVIMPSLWRESSGRLLFESMLLKTPVIAGTRSWAGEVIESGLTGLISDVDSDTDLSDKIESLYRDRGLYESIRGRAFERFSGGLLEESMPNAVRDFIEREDI